MPGERACPAGRSCPTSLRGPRRLTCGWGRSPTLGRLRATRAFASSVSSIQFLPPVRRYPGGIRETTARELMEKRATPASLSHPLLPPPSRATAQATLVLASLLPPTRPLPSPPAAGSPPRCSARRSSACSRRTAPALPASASSASSPGPTTRGSTAPRSRPLSSRPAASGTSSASRRTSSCRRRVRARTTTEGAELVPFAGALRREPRGVSVSAVFADGAPGIPCPLARAIAAGDAADEHGDVGQVREAPGPAEGPPRPQARPRARGRARPSFLFARSRQVGRWRPRLPHAACPAPAAAQARSEGRLGAVFVVVLVRRQREQQRQRGLVVVVVVILLFFLLLAQASAEALSAAGGAEDFGGENSA